MSDQRSAQPQDQGLVLVLSGPVCAGKTTLADRLIPMYQAVVVRSRAVLARLGAEERGSLQALGEELDRSKGAAWIVEPVVRERQRSPSTTLVVLDAARTREQVSSLRAATVVYHAHVTADEGTRQRRYERRIQQDPSHELASYAELALSRTEAAVDELAEISDVVLDTTYATVGQTVGAMISALDAC